MIKPCSQSRCGTFAGLLSVRFFGRMFEMQMLFPALSQKQFVKTEEISSLLPLEAISETQ